jgi:hypothetical protein
MRIVTPLFVAFFLILVFAGNVRGQLSGDYDVGAGGAYTTLPAAISALNSNGVSGHVQFLLTDATYTLTAALVINVTTSAPTSGATVTIKPASGISPTITGSLSSNFVVQIVGTNYVTIDGSNSGGSSRNLTISNTSSSTPLVVLIASNNPTPITNVTLKNCKIINGSVGTATGGNVAVFVSSSSGNPSEGGYFSNITIQNNEISNTSNALIVNGRDPATGSSVSVLSNRIGGSAGEILASGIKLLGVDGGTVSGNWVSNFGWILPQETFWSMPIEYLTFTSPEVMDTQGSG